MPVDLPLVAREAQDQRQLKLAEDAVNDRTSLLPHSESASVTVSQRSVLRTEVCELVKLAGPLVLVATTRHWIIGITVFTVGRISVLHLAAASLGLLHTSVVGFSVFIGFNSALDTLSNQAASSKQPYLASLYMLRQCVALVTLMPAMFLFMWYGTDIIHFVSPQADVEMFALTRAYLRIMVWCLPAYGLSDCLRRFCYSIGHINGALVAGAAGAFVSISLNILLVLGPEPYRLGFIGAPIAVSLAYMTIFVILLIYALIQTPPQAWCGLSTAIFKDLGVNYSLGTFGLIGTASEWWAFELLGVGSTFLGPATQAATAIFSSVIAIIFTFPYALSLAASIRIGHFVGAGDAVLAKVAAAAAQRTATVIALVGASIIFLSRKYLAELYTGDPNAQKMVSNYIILLVVVSIADSLQNVSTGILRGAGLPKVAAQINVASYWGLGLWISIGATMVFRNFGSLWSGYAVAIVVAQLGTRYLINRINWQDQVCVAEARMHSTDMLASNTQDESV